ncbi:Sec23-binding domain of Sec16-domain-containing protein [Blakeslea trispora]|nr:Sec23-binding domain of Sec16-domain-containing protein [Blakeslea trispora]
MTSPYYQPQQQQQTEEGGYQFDPNVHYYYDSQQQIHYYDPNTNLEYQPYVSYTPQVQQVESRQPTPDVLLPCPEPNCHGENKPTSKFCEECGRALVASVSRSTTPASITRGLANQHISYYSEQAYSQPLQRPPTAPVYHASSPLYYNQQHQSMQDLYSLQQQQQQPDPLNRARGCPLVTFGFGGKMAVMFPRSVTDYYTSTVKSQAGSVQIRRMTKPNGTPLGPVLLDPKMSLKQKKKQISDYIQHRLTLLTEQHNTMATGSIEFHQSTNQWLLWKLVQVMLETDGTVNDKDKMDQAILHVLRPENQTKEQTNYFSLPDAIHVDQHDLSDQMLKKIEQLLLEGDRRGAVDYAIQEDLWAHALIISSCVDRQLWQQVIQQFVDREMNATPEMAQKRVFHPIAGNNQALRVMYALFSGTGALAIQEFVKLDVQHVNTTYGLQTVTPRIDSNQLIHWRTTVAMILANRTARDQEALAALGDLMKQQGWIEVAHICYLLSSPMALQSGKDAPQVRFTLLGTETNQKDTELSEIFEFVQSIHTSAACMPFLQGYKLAHAWALAGDGFLDEAQRYYEAIDQCIKTWNANVTANPYLHPGLLQQLNTLGELLEAMTGKKSG